MDKAPWFKLLLCDISEGMIDAWKQEWKHGKQSDLIPIEFFHMPFEDVRHPFDCIVSPANSFGLMDGGIDLYISKYFGGVHSFVPRVQKHILEEFCGQQPVGTCSLIPTGRTSGCRYLAHTPTMRLPQHVAGTDIAYRAMWSVLLAVRTHNKHHPEDKITSVLCSGLATGCGSMSFEEAAKQMVLAYTHFVNNPVDTDNDAKSTAPGSRDYLISWEHALNVTREVDEAVMAEAARKPGPGGSAALQELFSDRRPSRSGFSRMVAVRAATVVAAACFVSLLFDWYKLRLRT